MIVMNSIENEIDLEARRILAISADQPEKLFTGDLWIAKSEFHELSRRWHPDRNRHLAATTVFQRIAELYRAAQDLIRANRWRGAGVLELAADENAGDESTSNVVLKRIPYFKIVEFELGEMYVGETAVAFAVEQQYADLFLNANRRITSFRFANAPMRSEIAKSLPATPEYFATDERLIIILPKTADQILLQDLLEYLGGAIDARHVAWIINRLQNLACYFDYAGIVHQDISLRTVFVSPEFHTAAIFGGWWYAAAANEKISVLPVRTTEFAPPDAIRRKRADGRTDLELIRQLGRELIGVENGASIKLDKNVPAAMRRWFDGATSGRAVTDYELWRNVLQMDFGKPKFCPLNVEPAAIYEKQRF